ncbi:hypothetical protein HPP92_005639 [Vanilla planifolia]|uniref:Uncharacterized protein n=1 Tax=Vanilla planifolia TaxID=51239 RepID=A0A835RNZ1_VANPL|nr:hypothetical protein HPP92_005639 [Vanilla planifolia]
MEDDTDMRDWELVISSDLCGNLKSGAIREEAEGGIIKSEYFTLDSVGYVDPGSEQKCDGVGEDSDSPSWLEPDSGTWFAETSRGQSIKYHIWSEESSEGGRSLPDSEKVELGSMGDLSTESASEGTDSRCESLGSEGEGIDNSGSQDLTAVTGGASEEDESKMIWWKIPWKLFKVYIFRVRPVLSVSVALAMLGMIMLWRKLYRLKRRRRTIPLRIATDDKASQFAASATRLNNAVSAVRRLPILRPSLGGVGQWAALPPSSRAETFKEKAGKDIESLGGSRADEMDGNGCCHASVADDVEGTREPLLRLRMNTTSQIALVGANLCPIESLDYEFAENDLLKEDWRSMKKAHIFQYVVLKWTLALLIGLATGIVGFFNNMAVENIAGFKLLQTSDLMLERRYFQAFVSYAGCNLILAAAASALCAYIAPAAAGSGIPEVKAYLNGIDAPSILAPTTLFVKIFGSIFGVSAGFVVGKEGPMVHTGACIANLLGQGGSQKWRSALLWRTFFTTAVVAVVLRAFIEYCRSGKCGLFGKGGLIMFDINSSMMTYSSADLVAVIVLGVIGGIFGSLYNFLVNKIVRTYSIIHE